MKRKHVNGTTMIEVLTASFMTVMVVTAAVSTMLYGLSSWAKGQGKIYAESDSQKAMRVISQQLREAMYVGVDSNGLGLNYRRPQLDGNGNYVTPAVWDGVTRRIELVDGTMRMVTNGQNRTLCQGVVLTDPQSTGGIGTYLPFTSSGGTIIRQVNVQIVTRRNTYKSQQVYSRSRETIYLRNVPQLTR